MAEPAAKRRKAAGASEEEAPSEAAAEEDWTYDRLWDAPEISQGWHSRNTKFWRSQSADVRGVTGGGVSRNDLDFSHKALGDLARERGGGAKFGQVLDCGAGIGRVSDAVLRRHSDHIDLVEFVKKHLDKAREKLPAQGKAGCTFAFHCCSMQKFLIKEGHYDLIWCQWMLMYLTDSDALDLLKRARDGLRREGGVLIVKENISTPEKATYFDDAEGELWEEGHAGSPVSCVRTPGHYEDLFDRAGLRIRQERPQTEVGAGAMDMSLWVLVPGA